MKQKWRIKTFQLEENSQFLFVRQLKNLCVCSSSSSSSTTSNVIFGERTKKQRGNTAAAIAAITMVENLSLRCKGKMLFLGEKES